MVDEAALAQALATSEIAAAGLDVTSIEPLPSASPLQPLLTDPAYGNRLLVTPHIAGDGLQRGVRESRFALRQAVRLAARRPLLSVVDPEHVGIGDDPATGHKSSARL